LDDFLSWTLYTAKWSSHTGYYSNSALGQDGSRACPIEHRILAWGRQAEVAAAVRRAAFFVRPGKLGGGNPTASLAIRGRLRRNTRDRRPDRGLRAASGARWRYRPATPGGGSFASCPPNRRPLPKWRYAHGKA